MLNFIENIPEIKKILKKNCELNNGPLSDVTGENISIDMKVSI